MVKVRFQKKAYYPNYTLGYPKSIRDVPGT